MGRQGVFAPPLTCVKPFRAPLAYANSVPTYKPGAIMDTQYQAVTREKLLEDMRVVLADSEQLLKAVIGQSGEKLAALQPLIQENLRKAKAHLEEFQQAASDQARAAVHVTDDYVHEHPWRIASVGALVGVALGLLIGRR